MSDFLGLVVDAFSALLDRGQLAVESSGYDPQAFGNAAVVLAGENVRVRVIRDRDECFADAASRLDPEDWHPLQRVIRAAGAIPAPPEGLLSPVQAAQLVERNFVALDMALAAVRWQETKAELARLAQEALAHVTNRLKTVE